MGLEGYAEWRVKRLSEGEIRAVVGQQGAWAEPVVSSMGAEVLMLRAALAELSGGCCGLKGQASCLERGVCEVQARAKAALEGVDPEQGVPAPVQGEGLGEAHGEGEEESPGRQSWP